MAPVVINGIIFEQFLMQLIGDNFHDVTVSNLNELCGQDLLDIPFRNLRQPCGEAVLQVPQCLGQEAQGGLKLPDLVPNALEHIVCVGLLALHNLVEEVDGALHLTVG